MQKLLEKHVQQTIVEFMQLDGWRATRTHPLPPLVQRLDAMLAKAPPAMRSAWALLRGYVSKHTHAELFGEPGMPDYQFTRYELGKRHCLNLPFPLNQGQAAEVMWHEYKRPGEKPSAYQIAWHEAERARGALVMVVDDIDLYIAWYKSSGLRRRV